MNPFLGGNDGKDAMAIILKNSSKGSDKNSSMSEKSDKISDLDLEEEMPEEAAMRALLKAIAIKDVKKALKAFKIIMEYCDMSEDDEAIEEDNDDKMSF